MQNFDYHNPVNIQFGEGQISQVSNLIPKGSKVMLTYGGGSIKKNGVYDQVIKALDGYEFTEFGGIEPNPQYETLMKATEIVKSENVTFLLSVGGGSVLDGTKFIAAASKIEGEDPWNYWTQWKPLTEALSVGAVLTLPATGSEMNFFSVVSRGDQKHGYGAPVLYPKFSILDPTTTYSLPVEQVSNGVVDAFVHTIEQYLTYPQNAMIQDRFCEGILLTLIEVGPKLLKDPKNYEHRANIMWAATMALNGLIGKGVAQDWATHMVGHELTASKGIAHARTLAVVLPSMLEERFEDKKAKLTQYGKRVWNLTGADDEIAKESITKTAKFFEAMGVSTKLSSYTDDKTVIEKVSKELTNKGMLALGEKQDVTPERVVKILKAAW